MTDLTNRAFALRLKGHSYGAIARKLSVGENQITRQVQDYCRSRGIPEPPCTRPIRRRTGVISRWEVLQELRKLGSSRRECRR